MGANLNYFGTKNLILNYNYIGGAEAANGSHRQVQEINAVYRCNDRISIAIDYIYGQQAKIPGQTDVRWSSFTVSVKAQINDMYSILPRYEIFDDSDQGFAISGGLVAPGLKQKMASITLANNFNLGDGLEARIELRSDKSDSNTFFYSSDHSPSYQQDSYTAAFLYAF